MRQYLLVLGVGIVAMAALTAMIAGVTGGNAAAISDSTGNHEFLAAVPEPATLFLILIGAISTIRLAVTPATADIRK